MTRNAFSLNSTTPEMEWGIGSKCSCSL